MFQRVFGDWKRSLTSVAHPGRSRGGRYSGVAFTAWWRRAKWVRQLADGYGNLPTQMQQTVWLGTAPFGGSSGGLFRKPRERAA